MRGSALAALCVGALAARAEAPRVGEIVPDFSAVAVEGTALSLHDLLKTQRVVVVLFLSTACPYATYFGDHVGQLAEAYQPAGVLFVGVNSNQFETPEEMTDFAAAHRHTFPIIRDVNASIADRLGASCSPEAFVVDHDRRLRYRGWVQSKRRSPDLQRALDAVLAGRTVRLARTKAFGCAIDREHPTASASR